MKNKLIALSAIAVACSTLATAAVKTDAQLSAENEQFRQQRLQEFNSLNLTSKQARQTYDDAKMPTRTPVPGGGLSVITEVPTSLSPDVASRPFADLSPDNKGQADRNFDGAGGINDTFRHRTILAEWMTAVIGRESYERNLGDNRLFDLIETENNARRTIDAQIEQFVQQQLIQRRGDFVSGWGQFVDEEFNRIVSQSDQQLTAIIDSFACSKEYTGANFGRSPDAAPAGAPAQNAIIPASAAVMANLSGNGVATGNYDAARAVASQIRADGGISIRTFEIVRFSGANANCRPNVTEPAAITPFSRPVTPSPEIPVDPKCIGFTGTVTWEKPIPGGSGLTAVCSANVSLPNNANPSDVFSVTDSASTPNDRLNSAGTIQFACQPEAGSAYGNFSPAYSGGWVGIGSASSCEVNKPLNPIEPESGVSCNRPEGESTTVQDGPFSLTTNRIGKEVFLDVGAPGDNTYFNEHHPMIDPSGTTIQNLQPSIPGYATLLNARRSQVSFDIPNINAIQSVEIVDHRLDDHAFISFANSANGFSTSPRPDIALLNAYQQAAPQFVAFRPNLASWNIHFCSNGDGLTHSDRPTGAQIINPNTGVSEPEIFLSWACANPGQKYSIPVGISGGGNFSWPLIHTYLSDFSGSKNAIINVLQKYQPTCVGFSEASCSQFAPAERPNHKKDTFNVQSMGIPNGLFAGLHGLQIYNPDSSIGPEAFRALAMYSPIPGRGATGYYGHGGMEILERSMGDREVLVSYNPEFNQDSGVGSGIVNFQGQNGGNLPVPVNFPLFDLGSTETVSNSSGPIPGELKSKGYFSSGNNIMQMDVMNYRGGEFYMKLKFTCS